MDADLNGNSVNSDEISNVEQNKTTNIDSSELSIENVSTENSEINNAQNTFINMTSTISPIYDNVEKTNTNEHVINNISNDSQNKKSYLWVIIVVIVLVVLVVLMIFVKPWEKFGSSSSNDIKENNNQNVNENHNDSEKNNNEDNNDNIISTESDDSIIQTPSEDEENNEEHVEENEPDKPSNDIENNSSSNSGNDIGSNEVTNLFEQAKLNTFITEVQMLMNHGKTSFMNYSIMNGGKPIDFTNLTDSLKINYESKLETEKELKKYFIGFDRNGNFTRILVFDDNYCFDTGTINRGTDFNTIDVSSIKIVKANKNDSFKGCANDK